MFVFLMILFVILCVFLALFVLMQQGKGDMGLGGLGGGSQVLFGGSGGQDFFEKATWVMGAIFMIGSLGLTMLKSSQTSRIKGYQSPLEIKKEAATSGAAKAVDTKATQEKTAKPSDS